MDDPRVLVAIAAIAVSAIFSAIGLFLGYGAQKRANRISIAKRLTDVSFLLSEDLSTLSRIRTECLMEIKSMEASDSGIGERMAALQRVAEQTETTQKQLDAKQEEIDKMSEDIDSVDPEKIEVILRGAYSWKVANKGNLELLLAIKNEERT
jgi:hypothetical protein